MKAGRNGPPPNLAERRGTWRTPTERQQGNYAAKSAFSCAVFALSIRWRLSSPRIPRVGGFETPAIEVCTAWLPIRDRNCGGAP